MTEAGGGADAPAVVKVFLVDDHDVVRGGLRALIGAEPDLEVVGEAATARDALEDVPRSRPDVVVLDVHLPDGSGIDVCRALHEVDGATRCLMLTSAADDEALLAAVLAGAAGYVLKSVHPEDLLAGIRRIAADQPLLDPRSRARLLERLHRDGGRTPNVPGLSAQERRVLELLTEGLTNRQIAERLGLAEKTVKNYVSNVLAKLGLQRRTQAAIYGAKLAERSSATESATGTPLRW